MPTNAANVLASFPPRALNPSERALFDEWLSRAADIPLAYVSGRQSDDPRLQHRIVIHMDPVAQPVWTVHAPSTGTAWLVGFFGQPSSTIIYDTLRDALNSIRAVLI
jgi:hypothetical protein